MLLVQSLLMKYRRFGRTELPMPVFSCGGMRYQFKWQDVSPQDIPVENQDNVEAIIHRALQLGINHIETARGYGSSEMQLGRVLPELPREKIIVQTKVPPMASAKEFLKTFDGPVTLRLNPMTGVTLPETVTVPKGESGVEIDIAVSPGADARKQNLQLHATADVDGFEEEVRAQPLEIEIRKVEVPKKK